MFLNDLELINRLLIFRKVIVLISFELIIGVLLEFINGTYQCSLNPVEEFCTSRGTECPECLAPIERRSNLSHHEFLHKYDTKRPVLITDVIESWKAMNWNKEFFVRNYGDQRVVMRGAQIAASGHVHFESLSVPLKHFAKHSSEHNERSWAYIEDELFIPQHPELKGDIGLPAYLDEDYFQLFPEEVRPWNSMLLWGTAYSRSKLHIDPYNWTGTNAVLSGVKKWKLYPPGQDHLLYAIKNPKSGFPLNSFKYQSPVDAFEPDLVAYPNFREAQAVEFDQGRGELLMIPPGWFHQAYNPVETMAISSQVMNSNNYEIILDEILKANTQIDLSRLPADYDTSHSPAQQVKSVMSILPQEILENGRKITEDILMQTEYGQEKYRDRKAPVPDKETKNQT